MKTNKTIDALNAQLNATHKKALELHAKIQDEYNAIFEDMASIRDMVSNLGELTNYMWGESDEILGWMRADLSEFEDCRKYFTEYMLGTHGIYIDWHNGTISQSEGEGIVINEEGNVYDTEAGRFILKSKDYRDDSGKPDVSLRNELIEAYMKKAGVYPGVFESNKNGELFLINTSEKA